MSQAIFNSLGSNYSQELIRLFSSFKKQPTKQQSRFERELKERLGNHFNGDVILTYKGRDAIELALQPLEEANVQQGVITQGLACHAIEEGIVRSGLVPVYADLEQHSLSPSVRTIEDAAKRAKEDGVQVSAVFIQHTLGYANPVSQIADYCRKNNLMLIEDLAQSFGGSVNTELELGILADVVICSFGRDKVIDAVSGGAVIFKKSYWERLGEFSTQWIQQLSPTEFPPSSAVGKELMYPEITSFIQRTHDVGVGKLVFKFAKMLGLLTSPIATVVDSPTRLPAAYISMALWQLDHLEEQLKHRRLIAEIYVQKLRDVPGIRCLVDPATLNTDTHLRVPIMFDDPRKMREVIDQATAQNIHIIDRWYRSVVDSGSLNYPSVYRPGDCPVAESTANRLLNLPTHVRISADDAVRVAHVITQVMANT